MILRRDRTARPKGRARHRQNGLSLVELTVAILILSIGVIAGLRGLDQSRLAIGGATPRILAQEVALNRAEEYRLYGLQAAGQLPRQQRHLGRSFDIEATTRATEGGLIQLTLKVRADSGEGAQLVTYLPGFTRRAR